MALGGYLRTRGLKDGLLGGKRGWLAIGAFMWIGRILKKILSRPSELISVERLEPGQSVTVSAQASKEKSRSSRRSRRSARADS